MKNSLIVLAIFAVGCLAGAFWHIEADMHNWSLYILYALMLQVGIGLGSNKALRSQLKQLSPKMLLVPLATITGTLVFSAIASLLLSQWSVFDCMAGSGQRFRLLFLIVHPDNPVQRALYRSATGYRAGYDCFAEQHHSRDDVVGRCATDTEIFRSSGTYFGCRCQFDGCSFAFHHPLFGKRSDADSHFSRHPDRLERTFLCEVVL